MGCRILVDEESAAAVFYCSTTGWAFGPVMDEGVEFAERFLKYLHPRDPRALTDPDLAHQYAEFQTFDTEHCHDCGEPNDYKCKHDNCKGCGCSECEDLDRYAELTSCK